MSNKLLTILLLFLTLRLFAAPGDIKWINIRSETNSAVEVCIEGVSTGGTYAMGWAGTNNIPTGTEKLVLTVTSPGYTTNGTETTITRTIYGGAPIRKPYPNEATKEERTSGSDVVIKLSLTEDIYLGDTITSSTILSGLYTQGTASAAASNVTATNASTLPNPPPIANWTWHGNTVETGDTMRVRAVAGHGHAQNGKTIALMRFIATDGTTTVTNDVADMAVDWTQALLDAQPTAEFVEDVDLTGMDVGPVRVDFVAYPWLGTNILDTRLDRWTGLTPKPTSLTNYNAQTAATGFIAVVDPTAGASPSVTNVAAALVNSVHYFDNIADAKDALASYTNVTIYVRAGITDPVGGTVTSSSTPAGLVTIENYPGDSVTFSTKSGSTTLALRQKIKGIAIDYASGSPFNGVDFLVFEQCSFNSASTALIANCDLVHVINCTGSNWEQNMLNVPGQTTYFKLVRGSTFTGDDSIYFWTAVGNKFTGWSALNDHASLSGGEPDMQILYNNKLMGIANAGQVLNVGNNFPIPTGIWIAQNVFENTVDDVGVSYALSGDNVFGYTNNVVEGNVFVGARSHNWYNDSGSTASWKRSIFFRNNAIAMGGWKTDTHNDPGEDGARVGNWTVHWGVNFWGNYQPKLVSITGSSSAFDLEFYGLYGWQKAGSGTSPTNHFAWVDDQSWNDTSTTAGDGDYHPTSSSPLLGRSKHVLPYDIEGKPWRSLDASGAYSFGNVYHVSTNGSDANDGLTIQTAWLTVQEAADNLVAGDTVIIHPGEYGIVNETTSGTAEYPITYLGEGNPIIQSFRVNNADYLALKGITFKGGYGTYDSLVRIESSGDHLTIDECTFGPQPLAHGTNFVMLASDNSINSTSVDWYAAGFRTNQSLWLAGYTQTNGAGAFILPFTNGFQTATISSISGNKMVLSGITVTDESPGWAAVFYGPDKNGIEGILSVPSSSVGGTDLTITNSTFYQILGRTIHLIGNKDVSIVDNRFLGLASYNSITPLGTNITVLRNLFLDNTNFIYGSQAEIETYSHDAGNPNLFDWIVGQLHMLGASGGAAINVTFRSNWWQNVHAQLTQFATASGRTNTWFDRNVMIGFEKPSNGSVDGYRYTSNTFYRVGFGTDQPVAVLAHSANTVDITGNVFVDIGNHANTNLFPYTTTGSTSITTNYNFYAQAEALGWQGYSAFSEPDGVNGEDPRFRNVLDPLGPDGLPFTDDDGLKPLPSSPIATLGIGALSPVEVTASVPIAHFTATGTTPGWFDEIDEDFDSAWAAADFWTRTNLARPWQTPDALGHVPLTVFYDARGSISGTWSTNSWKGIQQFIWDFGDGATLTTYQPTNTHTYLWPGTFTNTLTVVNRTSLTSLNGNSASFTNVYRVLDVDSYAGTIHFTSPAGNDTTGTGTKANPYATLSKAHSLVAAGDYIAALPGDFNEELNMNRDVATTGSGRIRIIGYGAQTGSFRMRYSNWTIEGFDIDGDPVAATLFAGIYVFQAADNAEILYNRFEGFGDQLQSGIYITGSSSPSYNPLDQSLNGKVIGNTWTNMSEPQINSYGGSNWLFSANRALNSRGEGDFLRMRGANHINQDNFVYRMNKGLSGGHPDFEQVDNQSGNLYWYKDLLTQRNWVEGIPDRNVDGGVITVTKETNSVTVTASAPIFEAWMVDDTAYLNIVIPIEGDGWSWPITNFISSTVVEVSSTYGVTNSLFTVEDTDFALFQIETGAFADQTSYTNRVVRNNIFLNVRGSGSDSNDGFKLYNNTFLNTPRVGGNITSGGGARGSSWGTRFTNNIIVDASSSANSGWYYTAETGDQNTNTTVYANYDLVYPTKTTARWTYNGNEANGINGSDPLFLDPTLGNLMLPTNSPAYGTGTDLSGLSGIEGFTTDFWGETRTIWSRGAFEFSTLGQEEGEEDTTDPTITITVPTSDPTWDNGTTAAITLEGTSSDDTAVTSVTWSNDRGGSGGADGTTAWSISGISLFSGSNVITVTAHDAAGNSGTDAITVTYSPASSGTTGRAPIGRRVNRAVGAGGTTP